MADSHAEFNFEHLIVFQHGLEGSVENWCTYIEKFKAEFGDRIFVVRLGASLWLQLWGNSSPACLSARLFWSYVVIVSCSTARTSTKSQVRPGLESILVGNDLQRRFVSGAFHK
jgi:hypothetical protein